MSDQLTDEQLIANGRDAHADVQAKAAPALAARLETLIAERDEAEAGWGRVNSKRSRELQEDGDTLAELKAAEAEFERRQALWTKLSFAISRRSTKAIRDRYKGNTPEWINGETDELTVIFDDLEAAEARLEAVIAERDKLELVNRGRKAATSASLEALGAATARAEAAEARVAELETPPEESKDRWQALLDALAGFEGKSEVLGHVHNLRATERESQWVTLDDVTYAPHGIERLVRELRARVAELGEKMECGHAKRFHEETFDESVPNAEPSEWCVYCEWERDHARRYELEAEALRFYKADGTFEELESAEAVIKKRKAAAFEMADLQRWKREALTVLDRWGEVAKLVPWRAGESKARAALAEVQRLRDRVAELEDDRKRLALTVAYLHHAIPKGAWGDMQCDTCGDSAFLSSDGLYGDGAPGLCGCGGRISADGERARQCDSVEAHSDDFHEVQAWAWAAVREEGYAVRLTEPGGWQPIETAPRDGNRWLCSLIDDRFPGMSIVFWDDRIDAWSDKWGNAITSARGLYVRPLPPPPAGAESGEVEDAE